MTAIATLHDLLVHQLRDLYSAERQLVQALPKMLKHATSPDLKDAIRGHLEETEQQVSRLEEAFELLDVSARGLKCKAMEGLVEECKELFEEDIDPEVLDAGLIAAAQRVEHYEIAGYGTVCEFARALGLPDVVALLEATLAEEKNADKALTTLAEAGINALAMHGSRQGESDTSDEDNDDMNGGADDRDTGEATSRASGRSGRTKVGSRRH